MKVVKKQLKTIALVFSVLIFCQSCRVYRHQTSTLENAVNEGRRVKIKTIEGETLRFKRIQLTGEKYYGVNKVKKVYIKRPLDESKLEKIRLYNKTLSIIGTILIVEAIVLVIAVATFEPVPNNIGSGLQFPN